jgi:hypothetical protein
MSTHPLNCRANSFMYGKVVPKWWLAYLSKICELAAYTYQKSSMSWTSEQGDITIIWSWNTLEEGKY